MRYDEVTSTENDRPSSLVLEVIDYNMPLTTTYMKQMKLQCMSNSKDDSSLSSEEEAEMSEPTWLAADLGAASDLSPPPSRGERMRHSPQNAHSKEDDGKENRSFVRSALVCVFESYKHAVLEVMMRLLQ
ncbi:nucleolar protein 4-like [Notolabrus celidotus]|uniref:nucleolar protein 4-like n=1 Tax=Notolabrus celidotus TaxID=1203425 RepID=UPI00149076D4|nr:nucleolar protein 4-like [Notolabrus celidotus]